MMDASKYRVGYFPVDAKYNKWVEKDHIEKPPVWCSVDMRDGNQSLVIPMSLEEKLEYYNTLLAVGFKEIEVFTLPLTAPIAHPPSPILVHARYRFSVI